jgi:hypothetical protein
MRYFAQKTAFAVIAALIPFGVLRAEITTVILPENPPTKLTVSADKADSVHTEQLTFQIDPPPLADAKVLRCVLRVVPTPQPAHLRADQTVSVLWNDVPGPVGFWKAFSKTTQPYAPLLDKKACATGKSRLTLKTQSEFTSWDYYGSSAPARANLPRLIVTYDSPAPAHSGEVTDWTYSNPVSFFSSKMISGAMFTNPVSWDGAVYFMSMVAPAIAPGKLPAAEDLVPRLHVIWFAGTGNVLSRGLDRKIDDQVVALNIDPGSFAFVTAWGRLRILTTNAIYSCDLKALQSLNSGGKLTCDTTSSGAAIALKSGDTPLMGPDGTLYFKNASAAGRIVAYNLPGQEIWQSSLKFTQVSPISLNANGSYAYVLADIPVQDLNKAEHIALLRIDTATGDTVEDAISYGPQGNEIKPLLKELHEPAVVSKVVNGNSVDYVLAAGNAGGNGMLQLIAFEPGARCMWSQLGDPGSRTAFKCNANPVGEPSAEPLGKISAAPVPSLDGNYVFVAWQDGTVFRYPWFNTAAGEEGAFTATDLKPQELEKENKVPGVSKLLVDGGGSVYLNANNSLYVYNAGTNKMINTGVTANSNTLQFTTDGTLIGYNGENIFDYSPKSGNSISPPVLANKTIYSADTVTVPGNSGVQKGQHVILKGNNIIFPRANFKWPIGATLKVLSIPK